MKSGFVFQVRHQNEIWKKQIFASISAISSQQVYTKALRVNKTCHEKVSKKSAVKL